MPWPFPAVALSSFYHLRLVHRLLLRPLPLPTSPRTTRRVGESCANSASRHRRFRRRPQRRTRTARGASRRSSALLLLISFVQFVLDSGGVSLLPRCLGLWLRQLQVVNALDDKIKRSVVGHLATVFIQYGE